MEGGRRGPIGDTIVRATPQPLEDACRTDIAARESLVLAVLLLTMAPLVAAWVFGMRG